MVIKGARTIAEYAIRRWMEEQGFVMEYFTLVMDGNEGKLEDRQGDSLILVYDGATRSVHVKGEVGRKMGMNEFEAMQYEEQGKILDLLADIQRKGAPIELSIGWVDDNRNVMQGIVIKSAPPLAAQKLVEAGYSLSIMRQGVMVYKI